MSPDPNSFIYTASVDRQVQSVCYQECNPNVAMSTAITVEAVNFARTQIVLTGEAPKSLHIEVKAECVGPFLGVCGMAAECKFFRSGPPEGPLSSENIII